MHASLFGHLQRGLGDFEMVQLKREASDLGGDIAIGGIGLECGFQDFERRVFEPSLFSVRA